MMTSHDASGEELPDYTWVLPTDPSEPWIGVRDGDLPCEVWIRLGQPECGRVRCIGLRIGEPGATLADRQDPPEHEVTSTLLRQIHLSRVLQALREHAGGVSDDRLLTEVPASEWDRFDAAMLGRSPGQTFGELLVAQAGTLSVRRGRRGTDQETLRGTAEVYLQARSEGHTDLLAETARRIGVHASTVSRRLQGVWERFPELRPEEGDER